MKKRVLFLIIAIILTLVGGYFYSFVKRDVNLYDDSFQRSEMVYAKTLTNDGEFAYAFDCDKDKLTGLKLLLTVNGEAKKSKIYYTLYDQSDNDKVVASESMRLSRFKNGKFTTLKFKTIKHSENHIYRLEITTNCENNCSVGIATEPNDTDHIAFSYTYVKWDAETMVVFVMFVAYLIGFIAVLMKLFRK